MDPQIEQLLQLVPILRGKAVTVTPLGGGLTNRNYRVECGGETFVLRVGGEKTKLLGIDRACEVACARAAAMVGVGAEVIAYLPEHAALVTRFVPGRTLEAADVRRPAVLRRLVGSLRRVHDAPPGAGSFRAFEIVRSYHRQARKRGVELPADIAQALERLARVEQAVRTDEPPCPCHNDLLAGNFFDDGATVRIIDWEYAGMGDRFFDLGNLAVNNDFAEADERLLLELYFGAVRSTDLKRLRLMRLASDMRESMWGFLQAGISSLDFDYLAYGRKHLERFLAAAEREQLG